MSVWRNDNAELPWTWNSGSDTSAFDDWKWSSESDQSPISASHSTGTVIPTGQFDGEQFWGGVAGQLDDIAGLDYRTLRYRSGAMFRTNSYAQGIVARLVDNIIHKGLIPEFAPDVKFVKIEGADSEDAAANSDAVFNWADLAESLFQMFSSSKNTVDAKGTRTEAQLQAVVYREAFIDGDCLVICRSDRATGLPKLEIVSGNRVETPPDMSFDESVVDGVKLDKNGKHLGFYVYKGSDSTGVPDYEYIPSYGRKSGKKLAWLVYGPQKREDDVRGMPGLGIAIQPLNEILKYRGSAQLKASVNSNIVGFIKRTQDNTGNSSLGKAAARRDALTTVDTDASTTGKIVVNSILPGVFMGKLGVGEEPTPYTNAGGDVNFASFEAAVVAGLSWALGIPPEILLLSFNSNYSASQAALREFSMKLDKERADFAAQHCQNYAEEWFTASVLKGKIKAPGYLESLRDPNKYEVRQAWVNIDWIGSVKPSLEFGREVKAHKDLVDACWESNTRAARALTGAKFDRVVVRVAEENRRKAEAMRPLLELKKEFGNKQVAAAMSDFESEYKETA